MQSAAEGSSFHTQLKFLHDSLRPLIPSLDRIAVALFDEDRAHLHTFAHSGSDPSPLQHYDIEIASSPSLSLLWEQGKPRLINDMSVLRTRASLHTQRLLEAGYLASYTVPIRHLDSLIGFVFFNCKKKNAFHRHVLPQMDTTAFAISLVIVNEQAAIRSLRATMKSAIEVTHQRNPETGEHLKRMSNYARLIANELADEFELSDEYIEHLVLFSPLHDIGKISIPDAVLLKPDALTADEFDIMKSHTVRGRALVDALIRNHALGSLDYIDILRNIVELHHETWDGNGYPRGLRGHQIPIEARIIAVCDVFDALTHERPYKDRFPNDRAFDILRTMSGNKLDPTCVDIFIDQREAIEQIQRDFESSSASLTDH